MSNIPEIKTLHGGWKFRPPNELSLQILTNREIWFASIDTLNDPFDSTQDTIEVINKTEDALKERIEKIQTAIDAPRQYVSHRAGSYKPCFIFSLCGNVNNSLMWAHYARNHSGIAYGLDFSNDQKLHLRSNVLEVIYNRSISELYEEAVLIFDRYYKNNRAEELKEQYHYSMNIMRYLQYLTKGNEWSYEEERRLITGGADTLQGQALKYEDESLKYIVFGLQVDLAYKERVINLIKECRLDYVKLYQVHADFNNKQMLYEELN